MQIGIGLPGHVPGTSGMVLPDWARAAEDAGFASLGVVDRLLYDTYDPLTVLAAAAAVTERIRLVTAVLLAPLRQTALLAKTIASLDRLAGGRLELGLGVGTRPDDYAIAGMDFGRRGRIADEQIEEMQRVWRGEVQGPPGTLGPAPHTPGGPPLLFGGKTAATWERVARYGEGWICGIGSSEVFETQSAALIERWQAAGRDGAPRQMALRYFSLGPDAPAAAESYLGASYKLLPFRDSLIASTPTSDTQLAELVESLAAAGCDELLLFPCASSLDQVGLLADVVRPYISAVVKSS